jgi:hypothetical protein
MMSHLVPNAVAAEVILKLGALVADIIVHVHFSLPSKPSFTVLFMSFAATEVSTTILEPPHMSYFCLQAANIRSRL